MVAKLEKQRRRLAPALTLADRTARQKADGYVPGQGVVTVGLPTEADLGIPPFLDRKDPLIAEAMTAKRKAAEAEARKRMPLNERAALDLIRGTRKKAKANA
jgi:hypothetical protein